MAGRRRATRRAKVTIPWQAWLLSLLVLGCVAAWGLLVFMAISFGASARSGSSSSWALLALATLGAVACLFLGLLLGTRVLQAVGLMESRRSHRH